MSEAPALPPVRRVGQRSTLAYGFGAAAYGVKDFGFSTFLLLFYNQVLGLPAAQVGFAIMCALILDAFIDPLIGFLSDNTRSRWGRRHPWMYAAALPIAAGWLLLWNPPELSQDAMLVWVFATSVLVRTAISAYEVPSQALTPELSADYDERTRLTAYRYLFGWAGGMVTLFVTYTWLMAGPDGQPDQLNRANYAGFALFGAAAMLLAIFTSAIGTHGEIKRLPRPEIVTKPLGTHFRELWATIRNRAFLILMLAGLCYYSAQGISFALATYLYVHVWQFDTAAFGTLALSLFLGVSGAFVIAPRVANRVGKPVAAMVFMFSAAALLATPYALRLAGLFPAPGDRVMLPLLLTLFAFNTGCGVSATMLGASMMADVVEDSEAKTGRRSEGVFFSGAFFIQKCCSGLGIFAASLILHFAGFPKGAKPGTVGVEAIDRLTLYFILAYLALGWAAALIYRFFPFGRDEHAARVAALAKGEAG
ncbi:MFS transporter [Sphingomonas sp. G-3-2-10]|uniref:MFS transporter n=1 Tax=Sphingomonas sp. G-3-2-10 TaxID=2728838 RepID=UPI00146C430F|nr:MFS transporter [Sphingomonas sp. G-3-2-10]NML07529.1 sodium:melibiose symporter [Sphingomonas sp. G-3-2-10]